MSGSTVTAGRENKVTWTRCPAAKSTNCKHGGLHAITKSKDFLEMLSRTSHICNLLHACSIQHAHCRTRSNPVSSHC